MIVLLYIKTEETHVCQVVFQFHFRHVVTNVQKSLDHPGAISFYPIMAAPEELRGRKKKQMKEKEKIVTWKGNKKERKSTRHRHKQLGMTGHFFFNYRHLS
jgi:hypothetical protein